MNKKEETLDERILSWNGEYYFDDEDGIWRCVDTDEEITHLPSISCGKCGYAGEDENDGDGIECIDSEEDDDTLIEIYRCNKCGQLYIDEMEKLGKYGYGCGYWDDLTEEGWNRLMEMREKMKM